MDSRGGRVNGRRVQWHTLRPAERRRLVAPDGGSMLLAVRSDGGPFTAWSTVFERTARRIRERFGPRFPHVHPHCCQLTFAMATRERLVAGFYEQAARLSAAGSDADAALSHYLTTTEPLLVLRDLLGHSSVLCGLDQLGFAGDASALTRTVLAEYWRSRRRWRLPPRWASSKLLPAAVKASVVARGLPTSTVLPRAMDPDHMRAEYTSSGSAIRTTSSG